MKRLTKALLGVLMGTTALCTVAAFTGCVHEHDWDSDYTVDKAATCTEDGSKSIHCNGCDETKDVTVIPSGHAWESDFTVDTPATCSTDGSKSVHCANCDETKDVTPIVAAHAWSEWEVTTLPQKYMPGKATRTCSGENCDATDEMKEFTLPRLTHESYEKTEDNATCGFEGYITYTYKQDGLTFVFDVTTPATGDHTVDEWTTDTEPTCVDDGVKKGNCTECGQEVEGSIPKTGIHTPTLAYNKCEVCGTQPQSSDLTAQGNTPTINITVNPGEWLTVTHMFLSAGYVVYNYEGTAPIQIWYSTYGNGAVHTGNTTLNNGDTFYLPASTRGTGYLAIKSNSDEVVTGTIKGVRQANAPVLPTKLDLGATKVNASSDSESINTLYEFTATEDGENTYVLYCTDADAVIMKKDGSDEEYVEVSAPYAFTLSKGDKIAFQTLVDIGNDKTSYTVVLAMGEVHECVMSDWTEKSPADCTHAKVEHKVCTDENCPLNTEEERTVGEPLGHDWGDWTEKSAADCTHAKVEERTCTRDGCNGKETRNVGEPLGHSMTPTPAKTATCTEDGYEAYWTCSTCNKLFSDEDGNTVIAAPVVVVGSHNYAWVVDSESNKIVSACSECGAEKTSHDFDTKVEVTGTVSNASALTFDISSGANLMHINRGASTAATVAYYTSFTADKAGTYTFTFENIADLATQHQYLYVNDTRKAVNTDFTRVLSGRAVVSITIDLAAGDVCKLFLGASLPVGTDESYTLLTVSCTEATAE